MHKNTLTTSPVSEIPVQDPRPAVETPINLAADVTDFLNEYAHGDVHYCINAIVRLYRDSLPTTKRAGASLPETPSLTVGRKPKTEADQAKKAA